MRIIQRTTRALAAVTAAVGLTLAGAALPASAATTPTSGDVVGVEDLDVERYLGTWYQVAAVPAIFEVQCRKDVTARYTLVRDGVVGVRNDCRTWLGRTSSVTGEAKVLNAPDSSELNVSFLRVGGRYLHLGGANYVVTALGADYGWAVVGDPDRTSGFVLSRTPALTAAQADAARAALVAAGYDPCDLRLTPQTGGQSSRAPFC